MTNQHAILTSQLLDEIQEKLIEHTITPKGLQAASTSELNEICTTVKGALREFEVDLQRLESNGEDTSQLEALLLRENKRFERLLALMNDTTTSLQPRTSSTLLQEQAARTAALLAHSQPAPNSDQTPDLDSRELLQLHDRIIQNQDAQLDSLSELLGNQKRIGEQISDELEVQVNMLDEVDSRVENTNSSMRRAGGRLDQFLEDSASSSKAFYMIICLFLVLVIVIVISRVL